jgi:oxygen-independent coproporphyrinogen-3 oxidase
LNQPHAGLYLHIPFCARVCPYCDFAVRTGDAARRRAFAETLLAEIDLQGSAQPLTKPAGEPRTYDTIYFGGGTPSCLESADLARIVDRVGRRFSLAGDTRIFLEANPEDVSADNAAAWKTLGVRTLSLGVQSFDADELSFLGRTHSPEQAGESIRIARDSGFETVSVDLIYGLPGQSVDRWRRRMDAALAFEPDHLSCYQLTIHAGTRFGLLEKRGELTQLPEAGQADVFRATHEHLNAAGYGGYEVSAFAIDPVHRSRHNTKYWDHTPYLGLGPSAHSFDGTKRWWNLRKTDPWQQAVEQGRPPVDDEETLTRKDLLLEALMTGFRTYRGVDIAEIERRFAVDLAGANSELIARLFDSGLIKRTGGRLIPTLDGLAVADSLAAMFRLSSAVAPPGS